MNNYINRLLIGSLFIMLLACGEKQTIHTVIQPIVNITDALSSDDVLVVSHRGDWRNAPENSLQAIRNCIDMGIDMVEIDLKKTKDGHLILMHDKTIDRTTTGKGRPEDYTLEELKAFRLRGGAGHKIRHRIPTFEEVMELCKGKSW